MKAVGILEALEQPVMQYQNYHGEIASTVMALEPQSSLNVGQEIPLTPTDLMLMQQTFHLQVHCTSMQHLDHII